MKSHVSLEQKQCMVCGIIYDSGAILFDTRIRNGKLMESLEHNTVTGYGLCEEHQKLFDDGFIALVECSNTNVKDTLTQENAIRTGQICHLKRTVANDIFNVALPKDLPMVFIEVGVIEKIQAMTEK
jgi:hypothetical protein